MATDTAAVHDGGDQSLTVSNQTSDALGRRSGNGTAVSVTVGEGCRLVMSGVTVNEGSVSNGSGGGVHVASGGGWDVFVECDYLHGTIT